eukprot:2737844-Alexandrium_andersonii.AAC.1
MVQGSAQAPSMLYLLCGCKYIRNAHIDSAFQTLHALHIPERDEARSTRLIARKKVVLLYTLTPANLSCYAGWTQRKHIAMYGHTCSRTHTHAYTHARLT